MTIGQYHQKVGKTKVAGLSTSSLSILMFAIQAAKLDIEVVGSQYFF